MKKNILIKTGGRTETRIRIGNGESFEDIAADYPALTTDDLEAIYEIVKWKANVVLQMRVELWILRLRRDNAKTV